MGLWSFYFLAKLALYVEGYIRLDPWWNLLLLGFVLLPVERARRHARLLRRVRNGLGTVLALLLLWQDSWLPPLSFALTFLLGGGGPTGDYVVAFLREFLHVRELVVLSALLATSFVLRRRRLVAPVLAVALVVTAFGTGRSAAHVQEQLDRFYEAEAKRVVYFPSVVEAPDFDVVLLHVCSVATDDLEYAGLADDPFFKTFDLRFTNFNTATGHSGPAAIRLLRANCGHRPYEAMHQDAARECYLLENLRRLGYETSAAYDDGGVYQGFAGFVADKGRADLPLEVAGLSPDEEDFDGSAIYDDYALLARWWEMRQRSGAGRAALYFDAVSPHEGAHLVGDAQWRSKDPRTRYRELVKRLFERLSAFFELVARSGRNTLVVFVPEHGLALRGSRIQPPGIREVPLPQITRVPLGIKFIGKETPLVAPRQLLVESPTSYLAIAQLLSLVMKQPHFGASAFDAATLARSLPQTPWVAENETGKVVEADGAWFYFGRQGKWLELPHEVVSQ